MSCGGQAVLGQEQLVEDRVVEGLGAQQADVEQDRLADLADLAAPHDRRHRRLARHAHQRQAAVAALEGLGQGQRVGRVRVAAACGVEDLLLAGGDAGLGLPRAAVALEVRDEGGVDVVVLQCPDEQRRHEPAVLAHAVHHVVAGAGEHDVLVDARDLVGLAGAGEEVLVGLGLPRPEAGAGPGAARAALLAVDAVVGAQLVLEVEGLVGAGLVGVADHVVGARDDAACAAGAQARLDDLGVQLLPLRRPAGGLGGGGRVLGHGHGAT